MFGIFNLKSFLFCFACLLISNTPLIDAYSKGDFDTLAKVCPNVTQDDLDICKNFGVPDSPSGKCFLRCALQTMGMMATSGGIDKDNSIQTMIKSWPNFSAELNTKIFTTCYDQVHPLEKELAGTCELAYKLMKCLNVETRNNGYYKDFLKNR
uniref:Uncharacterized protein n=1 Tax=Cacopsylla melanoneura TaxID=428564 RepID=A0A8D8MEN0_9HEMI